MRVTKIMLAIVLLLVYLSLSQAGAQIVHVNNFPILMPRYLLDVTRTIPIQSYGDSLYIMSAWSNGSGVCSQRDRYGYWEYRFISSSIMQGMEFTVSPQGGFYVYDNISNMMYYYLYYNQNEKYCPGRPVFDQNDRIHLIEELSPNNYIYIVSDDTLNSLTIVDTLSNYPDFQRLITNPDHTTIGAVFFDDQNNQIHKYLSYNGYIDFSDPIIYDVNIYYPRLYDITLDNQNNIIAILGMGSSMDVYVYAWTEQFGLEFLEFGGDIVMQPIYYQISIGNDFNEMIILKNELSSFNVYTLFYYSSDGGNSWHRSLFEMPNAAYGSSLRTFNDTLHFVYSTDIFGSAQTWYYPITVDSIADNLTLIENDQWAPVLFSLLQNYPNPFNSSTTIEYGLPEAGHVNIEIYDLLGRKVETLVSEEKQAGRHQVVWDADRYASGLYFYRIETGNYSDTKRMVYLK